MSNISTIHLAASSRPTARDEDGKEFTNPILRNLCPPEYAQVVPLLEYVHVRIHQVLHENGDTIKSVYFLNDGLSSVLTTQPDGKSIEVALIGKEGFIGLPIINGFKTSALRIVAQADGSAYRLEAKGLVRILPQCPQLYLDLQRFSMILGMQSTQLGACNRMHSVVERLARWLLMSQDRIGGRNLPLTQEFLGQMLGTRRASVTLAAGFLKKADLIAYSRGSVTILSREGLNRAACSCYGQIEQQNKKWRNELN
jgi:CRP-like cAMP-binding protein